VGGRARPSALADVRVIGRLSGRRPVERALPAGLVVRPATRRDVERIVAIERAAFSDPWSHDSFVALLVNPRVLFAVADWPAERGGTGVVGYVVAWFVVDEAEVANVAVAPDARGRGIGARLLDEALRAARDRGASSVYLEVRDSNAAARSLYETRGFVEVGRRRRYYRRPVEDALVMRRVLEGDLLEDRD